MGRERGRGNPRHQTHTPRDPALPASGGVARGGSDRGGEVQHVAPPPALKGPLGSARWARPPSPRPRPVPPCPVRARWSSAAGGARCGEGAVLTDEEAPGCW